MMDTTGAFLIDMMEYSTGLKTFAFLIMTIIMYRQKADTNLAKWINRGFLWIFMASAIVTYFTSYVANFAGDAFVNWPVEWLLIVGMNIFPLGVAYCYAMVVYYDHTEEKAETHNQRQIRQDEREVHQEHQQEILDETALHNAATTETLALRHKNFSEAGVEFDKHVLDMDIERRLLTTERENLDADRIDLDQRIHNQEEGN